MPNYWTLYALSSLSLDRANPDSHFSPFKFNELHTASVAVTQDKLGEILVREGLITQEQLRKALLEQKNSGMRLGYTLVKLGFIEETEVSKMLARQYRMPAVDLSRFEVDAKILKLIPPDVATKHTVLPLKREGRTLTVAIADPNNVTAIEDIKFITRCDVFPVIAGEYTLRNAIDRYYQQSDAQLQSLLKSVEQEEDLEVVEDQEDEDVKAQDLADDAPVVKLINGLLTDAVKRGASDIHIEPFEHEMRVRYRVDGALQEVMKPPVKMRAALTSRVKIMAQLNIAERRVPQDGRIKLKMGSRVIDFRVSTLPVLFGEKIVLRILDKGNLTLDLKTFGFEVKAEADLLKAIENPYGMVLVTGPTGSGKTTTLYSALSRINQVDVNIMTAEDPVEYNLLGINQVLVRNEVGMTFAAALKAFLRQDPNIIMVGEIRDLETGSIAIKAALTGHLVLSTLHTNDAPSTITRMVDMGIEPFNVASAVNLIVAQRLVRRICKECKQQHEYTNEEMHAFGIDKKEGPFFKGAGCDTCAGTGYRGRQGLYEVMALSSPLRREILKGASTEELRDTAVKEGMLTLRMDGMMKVKKGVTTLEEVVKETAAG
ncbi:MAG TPA: type IV-A pilus assembly ATPase PilB [Gemmatimonadales bacterium]|nr:type IV-A pilus assembly ATPase PilB [Gemmatimonadales bacterium]